MSTALSREFIPGLKQENVRAKLIRSMKVSTFSRSRAKDQPSGNLSALQGVTFLRRRVTMADAHALKKLGFVLGMVTLVVTSMAGIVVSGHVDQAHVEYRSNLEAPSAESTR